MVNEFVDRGWAWVVLVATCCSMFISAMPVAIGVYVSELIVEQSLDRPSVALLGALQLGSLELSGPVSYLSEKTSHRSMIFVFSLIGAASMISSIYIRSMGILYLTFGIIPGLCAGVLCIQSMVLMNRYFVKYSAFANCLALSGFAGGILTFPPLFRATMSAYGWRSSLFIIAGMFLQGCVFAMLLRPVGERKCITGTTDVNIKTKTWYLGNPVFAMPKFYFFLISCILWSYTMSVVFVFAANLFYENGTRGWKIDMLLCCMGISNLMVRIVAAFVLNAKRWNILSIHIIATILVGVSLILFVVYPSMEMFFVACLLFGMSYGCTNCTKSVISRDIGGPQHYNLVYSICFGSGGLGTVGGPPLSGFIYNATQSYTVAFLVNSGMAFLSALILSFSFCRAFKTPTSVSDASIEKKTMEVFIESENSALGDEILLEQNECRQ